MPKPYIDSKEMWFGGVWGLGVCVCEVWLSQVRIWHSFLISGSMELNYKNEKKKKQCSPIACQPVPHLGYHPALSLYSLSWVRVSMMSTHWLCLIVSWSACDWQFATYGKHPDHASCKSYVTEMYECGLVILMKQTHAWVESNRIWISRLCCYII